MKNLRRFVSGLLVVLMLTCLPASADVNVGRIAGDSRIDTAVKLNKNNFVESDVVVIANGNGFADALVGGVLASYENAPLYLSGKDKLDPSVVDELSRLGASKAYVLGGPNSLSEELEEELLSLNVETTRLAGVNRYYTASAVAEEISSRHEITGPSYYADGRNFPDALASVPLVVKNKGLLYLCDGSTLSGDNLVAIGGENSVPGDLKRIAGPDRYSTALKIAEELNSTSTLLVDGTNYPDALSAGALANKLNASIILTDPSTLGKNVSDFLNKTNEVVIVGGYNSVSKEIENSIGKVETDKPSEPSTPLYDVVRVVDGDTLIVNYKGKEERVRLIGVDTPESVHPDKNKNDEFGKVASNYTKEKLEGKKLSLEFDVQERDKYGRLLAYAYLDGVMFNKTLLIDGMAQVATYPPNVKYVDDFLALEKEARNNKVGLWADIVTAEVEEENKKDSNSEKKKPTPADDGINHGDGTTPADLALIDADGNGRVTIKEARLAGIKLPISRQHWLYKFMIDRNNNGLVGE